jgi:integrase
LQGDYYTSQLNPSVEGVNAPKQKGRPRKTERKREAKSTGGFPFLTAANQYLERRKGILVESTIREHRRKYKMLDGILRQLKSEGAISTTNPANLTRADVQAFIIWMRTRQPKPLDPSAQNNYLRFLENICTFSKNPVVQSMRDEGERLPIPTPKDISSLSEEELKAIQKAAEGIDGWTGDVARFLVWFYPYTGVRPTELRVSHLEDLNLMDWTFYVRHPKGEMRYGKKRTVLIAPPARVAVKRFLLAREKHLREAGLELPGPLIPAIVEGSVKPYSANRLRMIKQKIERESGIEFKLKDFRPTFAQMTIDRNPNLLPDVSKQMGHKDTRTTETYYARIRDRAALQRLEEAWAQPVHIDRQESMGKNELKSKSRIDFDSLLTGYG